MQQKLNNNYYSKSYLAFFKRVLLVFEKNYQEIPLEKFSNDPYKVLVSTILSSRTKDEVTFNASLRLFEKANNIYKLSKLSINEIEKRIYPVGFYRIKARNLSNTSKMIVNKFRGNVPNTFSELNTLFGVGRKTANLVLNRAFDKPAIAVDTHVHRISNILGLVKTKNPIETEKELYSKVPKKFYSKINRLFVSIGRQYRSITKLRNFLEINNLI